MLTEKDIVRHCDSRVLRRARNIVRASGSIYDRKCQYDPGLSGKTHLHAQVKSGDDWRMGYDVIVVVDESAGRVTDYDCTCNAAVTNSGMCKHSAAVALAFLENPDTFIGYDLNRNAKSSESVSRVIASMSALSRQEGGDEAAAPQPEGATVETERLGTIDLMLTLVHDSGKWAARFRVAGMNGRYVLKDVGAFVDLVDKEAWFSYGAKLAFTHRIDMFAPHAREVVRFLQRAIAVRRELENDRLSGFQVRPSDIDHGLALSTPEVVELLGLYGETPLFVDDLNRLDHKPRRTHVIDGNPPVKVRFSSAGDGGFEIHREGTLSLISYAGQLYVWLGGTFYKCSPDYAECEDFLKEVYCNPAEVQFVSEADAPAFCSVVLPALERHLEVEEPQEMLTLRPRPCEVELFFDRQGKSCTCEAYARYDDERCDLLEEKGAERRLSYGLRNAVAEKRAREVLKRYFPIVKGKHAGYEGSPLRISDEQDIARLLFEGLGELRNCAYVYTTPEFEALISKRRPTVRVGLSIKAHLIDLKISSEDLPQKELAALLSSYRARRRYHRMEDGKFVDLADADLGELDQLADELGLGARDIASGEVELPAYRAFQLDELLPDAPKDEAFRGYVESFHAADPAGYEVPKTLQATLRPYQREGFRWLSMLCDMDLGGILADEMGLGKSVQLISLLEARKGSGRAFGPDLIVCPASLVYNWTAEFEKFAPDLQVVAIAGSKEERAGMLKGIANSCAAVRLAAGDGTRDQGGRAGAEGARPGFPDVLITSYDLLRRDLEGYQRIPFFIMALDEAQYIKNHATLAAQAVKSVEAAHRFALTGTPIENRLSELWSIFDFLMPGLLGPYQRFRERFEQPILDGDESVMKQLRRLVGHFVLRRLKDEVLTDLPDKSENVVLAQMGEEQARLYHAHEQRLRESLASKSKQQFNTERIAVLAELTKLRELCCDPRLLFDGYEGGSAKLETIMDLVGTAIDSGAKALVFSQFTSYLDLIAEELDGRGIAYYTITGATPKKRRVELVDAFNSDATPIFLVSLKAGGTGLNLTGASVVIHADPWWNAAAEDQATDRAHRIGQTRDVMVYKVIAKNTIEERIVRLQEAKSDLADKLVGEAGASLSSLTREELIGLLEG